MEGSWTTLFFSTYIFHLLWLIASLLPASRNSDLALGKCVSSVCVYYVFYHAVSGVISLLFFRFIIKYTEVSKSNAIFIRFYGLIVSLQDQSCIRLLTFCLEYCNFSGYSKEELM